MASSASRCKHMLQSILYLLPLCCLCLNASSSAATFSDWSVSGSNTLRGEYYDTAGDQTATPWPHDGSQLFDELDLSLSRRISAWERLQFNLSGLANFSDYRSNERGGVLERASLFWEKGDSILPFRLQAGDYYAAQSPRTLQRGLKGLQLELQPWAGQSIQFFSGIAAPIYRNLDSDKGIYSGASWLLEEEFWGAINLTAVHYNRSANAAQLALEQTVASLAWHKPFEIGKQNVELESEFSFFSGEHEGNATPVDVEDTGLFAQLSSYTNLLNYRLLYERYGQDFRPAGGALTADHRAVEGHVGWKYVSGRQVRGRLQSFRDNLESGNPLDTKVAGASLTGPLWKGSTVHGTIDGFLQTRKDSAHSVDADTRSLSLALLKPLSSQFIIRGGIIWTGTDDQLTDIHSISRQANIALDASFTAGRWHSTVSPGVVVRENSGASNSSEISPTLALNIVGGPHQFQFSHNWIRQDGHSASANDTDMQQTALAYHFQQYQHRLGVEFNRFERDPDSSSDTEAYRLSVYWSVSFDRPAQVAAYRPVAAANSRDTLPGLLDFQPGMSLAQMEQRLARNHQQPVYSLPGLQVYETRLFSEIDLHQRLALSHAEGNLAAVNLVIAFIDPGNYNSISRDYAKVRDLLLKTYGAPARYQEAGVFSPNLAVDLGMGRFERLLEWNTGAGKLRFGIPHRLDGQLRMEILYTSELPAGRNWGAEVLR